MKKLSRNEMKKIIGGYAVPYGCIAICQGAASSMHNCGENQNEQCYFNIAVPVPACTGVNSQYACGALPLVSCTCNTGN